MRIRTPRFAGSAPRLGFARVFQETNAFSPVLTGVEEFERNGVLIGENLGRAAGRFGAEIPGLIRRAELSGFAQQVERLGGAAVPLLSAWAWPAGPVTLEASGWLRERLFEAIERSGPLDGLYLALHGAMRGTAAEPEPEGVLLREVRARVGPHVPIAVSYDLHALMTPDKVGVPDVIAAYQTNPHRDMARQGEKIARALMGIARGDVRPRTAWRSLPMVLGGGRTIDLLTPMWPLFRRLRSLEQRPEILSAGLFMCHIWNDSPDLGWSVVVTTDRDEALAEATADELAERAWAVRHWLPPEFLSADEAIAEARRARWARGLGAVCMTDASDIVGAGGSGDNTHLLRALLASGSDLRAYVPVRDPAAVRSLWQREGQRASVAVGGGFAPICGPPLEVRGIVRRSVETARFGRAVVLDVGRASIVLSEAPPFTLRPSYWSDVGLDPWRADVLVLKSLFHFRLYHALLNRRTLLVRTQGTTDLDLTRGNAFSTPVHPYSPVDDWREGDRVRRVVRSVQRGDGDE
jgi:microcystin degradation protein MlrC